MPRIPEIKGRVMRFMGMNIVEDPTMPPDTIRLDPGSTNTIAHSPDRADALALAMSMSLPGSMIRTEEEISTAREMARYHAMRAEAERNSRRDSGVQLRIERRDDRNALQTNVRVRDLEVSNMLPDFTMAEHAGDADNMIREWAREASRAIACEVERRMLEQVQEAVTAMRTRNYGGPGLTVDTLRHARDILEGRFHGNRAERTNDRIEALALIEHRHIEHKGLMATLLDTTEQTWAEGEKMDHCFGKSYSQRVVAGEYIAYHISGPKPLPKSGLTLGFKKQGDGWAFDQIKGKKNDTSHCKHPEVLEMIDHVHTLIGKATVETRRAGMIQTGFLSGRTVQPQNIVRIVDA